jgi:hypothetical protein
MFSKLYLQNKLNISMSNKKSAFIIACLLLLTSCSKNYIQIFQTNSSYQKNQDGEWVFENDTVKLTYNFWNEKGIMSFSVYNKLNVPIYIDWKNSAFIYNGNKLNYWVDKEETKSIGSYAGFAYKGPLIKPGFAYNEGIQSSASTTTKPERVTFIPPQSNYYRSQFYLLPVPQFKMDSKKYFRNTVPRNDKPTKKTNVYEVNYNYQDSPLKFRNYISISMAENATNFSYIDNEFYLQSVKEMDYGHYRGTVVSNNNGVKEYSKPYKNKTSFYIKIPTENSQNYKNSSFK